MVPVAVRQQAQPQCSSSTSKGTIGFPARLRCEAPSTLPCVLGAVAPHHFWKSYPFKPSHWIKKIKKFRVLFPLGNPQHLLSSDLNLGPGCAEQTEGCPNGAAKISCSCRGNFTIGIPAHGQPDGGVWRKEGGEVADLCPVPHRGAVPLLSTQGGTCEGNDRLHQDDLNH